MVDDSRHGGLANTEEFGQLHLRESAACILGAQVARLLIGQYDAVPPLAEHVLSIIFECAQEKVIRTDARWIVTMMENTKSIRNGSEMQLPRDSMRRAVASAAFRWPKNAVAELAARPGPHPARPKFWMHRTALVDLLPEANIQWPGAALVVARRTAKNPAAPFDFTGKSNKCSSAGAAGPFDAGSMCWHKE